MALQHFGLLANITPLVALWTNWRLLIFNLFSTIFVLKNKKNGRKKRNYVLYACKNIFAPFAKAKMENAFKKRLLFVK